MSELRHLRIGERVEFGLGKSLVPGEVAAFRLVPSATGDEIQMLSIRDEHGELHAVNAAHCRLIAGRAPPPAAASARPLAVAAIDTVAAARRGVTPRGATGLSVDDIMALSADYLALLELAAAAMRGEPHSRRQLATLCQEIVHA